MTLQERRIAAGLTQTALAEMVGRQQAFIGKLECGMTDINNIELRTAYKLAKVLHCSIDDLVDVEKVQ